MDTMCVLPANTALSESDASQVRTSPASRFPWRFIAAGAIFLTEMLLIAALGHPWLPTGQIATGPLVFLAALLFFGRASIEYSQLAAERMNRYAVALHGFGFSILGALTIEMLRGSVNASSVVVAVWVVLVAVLPLSLIFTLASASRLFRIACQLGRAWFFAVICAIAAVSARQIELFVWNAPDSAPGNVLARAAFSGASFILSFFYRKIDADPATRILGTDHFQIRVAGACSGVEGLSLGLIFLGVWMYLERRHLRLERALLLAPIALAALWLLNLVRLSALIAIGDHSHPQLALTGFHTEAGWIAFIAVTLAILLAGNRIAWFHREAAVASANADAMKVTNPAVTYLLPYLTLLAAALLTRTFSTGFETLYPVRVLAVMLVFALLLKRYAVLFAVATRPSLQLLMLAVFAGAILGVVTIAVTQPDVTVATGLAQLASSARIVWISAHVFATVVVVPCAEELAFRGFLARFLSNPGQFERAEDSVSYRQINTPAIVFSSAAYAAMYGHGWPVALATGLVCALVAKRSNSLLPAIATHIAANLIFAVWSILHPGIGLW